MFRKPVLISIPENNWNCIQNITKTKYGPFSKLENVPKVSVNELNCIYLYTLVINLVFIC